MFKKTATVLQLSTTRSVLVGAFLALLSGCSEGTSEVFGNSVQSLSAQVGEPCVLEDEDHPDFSGFSRNEVHLAESEDCRTGLCLVKDFQGRVTCPEGQEAGGEGCLTLSGEPVDVSVLPQLEDRPAEEAVVCSCRCDGEGEGPFCECPSGFACEPTIEELGISGAERYAGSYCVPE